MPAIETPEVPSPCIKLCTLDAAGKVCLGCGRTIAEIATWGRMDNAARRLVMARLSTPAETTGVPG